MNRKQILFSIGALVLLAGSCAHKSSAPSHRNQAARDAARNWKSYKSDKYPFEFKYPTDWFAEECGLTDIVIGNDQIGSGHCGDAGPVSEGNIQIWLTDYSDIAIAARQHSQRFENPTRKSVTVADTSAVEIQGIAREGPLEGSTLQTDILLSHRGRVFVLSTTIQNPVYRSTFDHIVATFKVTR